MLVDGRDYGTDPVLHSDSTVCIDDKVAELKKYHVDMSTKADYLKNNQSVLENTAYTLNEQILAVEQCDLADAITSFSWAQYCYNAALKMGNSILSESLMDYVK